MGSKVALIITVLLLTMAVSLVFFLQRGNMKKSVNTKPGTIRYIPIGDSYTIGEGLPEEETWPYLLTQRLQQDGVEIVLLENPAVTGWTTQQAIDSELPLLGQNQITFSTILIGANDQFGGGSPDDYSMRLKKLLDEMERVIPDKKILLITIPDYVRSPAMKAFSDKAEATRGLEQFNEIIKQEGARRGLPVADIYPLSQQIATDESMFTSDGLHPSAKQVQLWEEVIYTEAKKMLK